MNRLLLLLIALTSLISSTTLAQSVPPKREFRGAWIATVLNLDWPSTPGLPAAQQQAELIAILDELHEAGINAVMFQVRSECDAMYASAIEPWSHWLTAQQGRPPFPFYDPLDFAINEAHKRGIELHAWFNPYRAVREVGNYPLNSGHVTVENPEWVLTFGTLKTLDPGLPQVREYITSVVLDVVNRYDLDGVHFDDYFYPYPPSQITNQDAATFANHPRGFTNLGDWRRDNVNLMVEMVFDSIQVVKPYVKFGISPFGIWKNGVPTGITGLDAYNTIYCDAVSWLNKGIVDYITPQLYWPFGGGQDYGKLQPWWASQTHGRHFYVGQGAHRIATAWTANEMPRQLRLNRSNADVQGSVFFRARIVMDNPKGFEDSLKTDFYRHPALSPIMAWKDSVAPNVPANLRYDRVAANGPAGLKWDLPAFAADGDSASRYVIYRFDQPSIPQTLDNPSNIIAIEGRRFSFPETPPNIGAPYYFVVTALDRNSNESSASNVLALLPPPPPVLAYPVQGSPEQPPQVTMSWFFANASSYRVQVSADSSFATGIILDKSGVQDTFSVVAGLEGQQLYHWRANASNAAGTSEFSASAEFFTGFPATPLLASPAQNGRDIPADPTFVWHTTAAADFYQLQVSRSLSFDSAAIAFDVANLLDTTYAVSGLEADRFYFWRVNATNELGVSKWSEVFRFKTAPVTAVADAKNVPGKFALQQNYPNPFNPVTTIAFDLPTPGLAHLSVFDLIGRELAVLVDENRDKGHHEVIFDASALPSGTYFYRLQFGKESITKRMLVVK